MYMPMQLSAMSVITHGCERNVFSPIALSGGQLAVEYPRTFIIYPVGSHVASALIYEGDAGRAIRT